MTSLTLKEDDIRRFWLNVRKGLPDECWPWKLRPNSSGYGEIKIQGRMYRAHRIAYLLEHGHFPENALHKCHTKLCCNPQHLVDGSHADNMKMTYKTRSRGTIQQVRNKWQARVMLGTVRHSKNFDSITEAEAWINTKIQEYQP